MTSLRKLLRGLGRGPASETRQAVPLGCESLEPREVFSADPLPVLLVTADERDFYFQEYHDTRHSLEAAGLEVVVAASTTSPATRMPTPGRLPEKTALSCPTSACKA